MTFFPAARAPLARRGIVLVLLGALAACSSTSATAPSPTAAASSASPAVGSPAAGPSPSSGAAPTALPSVDPAPPAAARPVAAGDPLGDGVLRIQVNSCSGVGMANGSAFFVAPDQVLTAAHLFDRASSVAVRSASGVVRGQLMGLDRAHDLALVRVLPAGDGARVTGHVFALSTAPLASGEAVTALGNPLGRLLYRAAGHITGEASTMTVRGSTVDGVVAHDAVVSPGIAGGPLLGPDGRVVAMDLVGDDPTAHRALPMAIAAPLLRGWQAHPVTTAMPRCAETGPPSMTSIHADAPAVKAALTSYVWGMQHPTQNDPATGLSGLQLAWRTLGAAQQKRFGSASAMLAAAKGSVPTNANVDDLHLDGAFTDQLRWTVQWEGPAKACHVDSDQVLLDNSTGRWVMDSVTSYAPVRAC